MSVRLQNGLSDKWQESISVISGNLQRKGADFHTDAGQIFSQRFFCGLSAQLGAGQIAEARARIERNFEECDFQNNHSQ